MSLYTELVWMYTIFKVGDDNTGQGVHMTITVRKINIASVTRSACESIYDRIPDVKPRDTRTVQEYPKTMSISDVSDVYKHQRKAKHVHHPHCEMCGSAVSKQYMISYHGIHVCRDLCDTCARYEHLNVK